MAAYSTLTGERYEDTPTWNDEGALTSLTRHRIPVLSPAQISQLPARHVVIIRRGMAPAVGTVRMAWTRSDVRAARRAIAWDQRVQRWAEVFERLHDAVGEWAENTTVGGVSVATRLGITIHRPALPTEITDPEGGKP